MFITVAWAWSRDNPFTIDPHDEFELAVLVPGQVVRRWTHNITGGRVLAPMPCHPAQHVTVPDPRHAWQAHCRICGRAYDLDLIDENDGGWAAQFTCVEIEILLSRARRNKPGARR